MANKQFIGPANRAFTSNGFPAPGATLSLYLSGTLTPANFYADDALMTSLGPTLTANGAGRFEDAAYQDEFTAFRVIYRDELGVQLDDIDPFFFGYEGPRGPQGIQGDVAKVLSRTELSEIAVGGQATGLSRWLVESGREGMFVFDSSDLSAEVTADTLQGLYVAPASDTTGASGAWRRSLPLPGLPGANEYHLEWWGMVEGYGPGAELFLNAALAILPDGFTLRFGPYDHALSEQILINQAYATIKGVFGQTKISNDADNTYWTSPSRTVVTFTNTYPRAEGIIFDGPNHFDQSGGGFCLGFSGGARVSFPDLPTLTGPIENPQVINCAFVNASEGLIFFNDYQSNPGTVWNVVNPQVRGCIFSNLNYQGLALFGVTGGDISYNNFIMAPHRDGNGNGIATGFATVFRLLSGSSGYSIHDNTIYGLGINANASSDTRSFVFWFAAEGLNGTDVQSAGDIHIYNNKVSNYRYAWGFDRGPEGTLLLEGNTFINPDTQAVSAVAASKWDPQGPVSPQTRSFGEIILRGNVYRGISNGHDNVSAVARNIIIENELHVWGASTDTSAVCVRSTTFSGIINMSRVEIKNNRFIFPDGASELYLQLDLYAAGTTGVITNNEVPEGTPTFGVISASGSGQIKTSIGGAYTVVGSLVTPGDNTTLPSGTHAASVG